MNKTLKNAIILLSITICISCNGKEELFEKYDQIKNQIENDDFDGFLNNIDARSREYLEVITNPANMNFDSMQLKTQPYDLEYISLNYLYDFGLSFFDADKKYFAPIKYYQFSAVPFFDIFSEPMIFKKKSKAGSNAYITIGRKTMSNVYLTKEIRFRKEDGDYKLNMLDLFTKTEKDLKSAYKQYEDIHGDKPPFEIRENKKLDSTQFDNPKYCFFNYVYKNAFMPTSYRFDANEARQLIIE